MHSIPTTYSKVSDYYVISSILQEIVLIQIILLSYANISIPF